MRYGIIINLDYENHSYDICHILWTALRDGLLEVGFRQEGRIFTIDMPGEKACDLAKHVVDRVEERLIGLDDHIHDYWKEFYGVDLVHTVNLLLPTTDGIEVDEA